jgi:hypothetical protein
MCGPCALRGPHHNLVCRDPASHKAAIPSPNFAMADEQDRSGPSTSLFHGVQFAMVLSEGLSEDRAHEVPCYIFPPLWLLADSEPDS